LIANGHRAADVWDYTPKQLIAFMFLANKRRQRDRAEDLTIHAMAARGEPRAVKKMTKDLQK
jgi:hypothetical protein